MWNPVIWRKVAWLIAAAIVAMGVYMRHRTRHAGRRFYWDNPRTGSDSSMTST